MLLSILFHPNMNFSQSFNIFRTSQWTCPRHSLSTFYILEIFHAHQYRIYKLHFCSYNFHIFRFSRSGRGEVDVYRLMSKHSSDYYVLLLSRSLVTPRHRCVIMHEVVDESLRKICLSTECAAASLS